MVLRTGALQYGVVNALGAVVGAKYDAQLVVGSITSDVTLPDSRTPFHNLYFAADVKIDTGSVVTIRPGTTLYFAAGDSNNIGFDENKVELIVRGTLMANGNADSAITFTSANDVDAETPAEGDWWGIFTNGGRIQLDFASVRYSQWGSAITTLDAASYMSNSVFQFNSLTDIKTGSDCIDVEISENEVTVGGGIGLDIAAGYILHNMIVGDADTDFGILFASSSESTTVIEHNIITEIESGVGISLGVGIATVVKNEVYSGAIGIEATAGYHQIGTDASSSDNILDGPSTSIRVTRGGFSSCPNSAMDLVINNNKISNYSNGLYVQRAPKSGYATVDAGIGISGSYRGLNQFDDAQTYGVAIVAATSACDTLRARGNFFGPNAGTRTSGKVDTTGTLTSAPATIVVGTEPVEGRPGPLRIARATPNPTRGTVRFDLESALGRAPIKLQVLDVAGRLVRELVGTVSGPVSTAIEWDGDDEHGRPAANGIYFARVRNDTSVSRAVRIVVAR